LIALVPPGKNALASAANVFSGALASPPARSTARPGTSTRTSFESITSLSARLAPAGATIETSAPGTTPASGAPGKASSSRPTSLPTATTAPALICPSLRPSIHRPSGVRIGPRLSAI